MAPRIMRYELSDDEWSAIISQKTNPLALDKNLSRYILSHDIS
jgi:hypothetical protein